VDKKGMEEEATEDAEYNELALLRLIRLKEIDEENRVVQSDEEEFPTTEKQYCRFIKKEKREKVSIFDNGKVRKLKTFEEIVYDHQHPENNYARNAREKQKRKFNRKYPNPEKRGDVVNHKYGRVYKEWYGYTRFQQEKALEISDNIKESFFLYSCGTFDILNEGGFSDGEPAGGID
jgi:hypothetical protein